MTHPLRCETCDHYEMGSQWCYYLKERISNLESTLIERVGCASHSDAGKERERVLELLNDLRRYANGEYKEADLSDNEHDLRIHLEYENRIWGIMKELRQGGE